MWLINRKTLILQLVVQNAIKIFDKQIRNHQMDVHYYFKMASIHCTQFCNSSSALIYLSCSFASKFLEQLVSFPQINPNKEEETSVLSYRAVLVLRFWHQTKFNDVNSLFEFRNNIFDHVGLSQFNFFFHFLVYVPCYYFFRSR